MFGCHTACLTSSMDSLDRIRKLFEVIFSYLVINKVYLNMCTVFCIARGY